MGGVWLGQSNFKTCFSKISVAAGFVAKQGLPQHFSLITTLTGPSSSTSYVALELRPQDHALLFRSKFPKPKTTGWHRLTFCCKSHLHPRQYPDSSSRRAMSGSFRTSHLAYWVSARNLAPFRDVQWDDGFKERKSTLALRKIGCIELARGYSFERPFKLSSVEMVCIRIAASASPP